MHIHLINADSDVALPASVSKSAATQKACEAGFRENEKLGFKFGPIGFGGTHVHLRVDVPKRYSKMEAADKYIKNQEMRHHVEVIRDVQLQLQTAAPGILRV